MRILQSARCMAVLSFCVLFSACGGSRKIASLSRIQPQQIASHIENDFRHIETMQGKGLLVVEMPEANFRGEMQVHIDSPDSLFFKIEAGLGVDVGFFFANRSRFSHYSPLENAYFSGPTSKMNRLILFQMKISFDELLYAALGSFHFQLTPEMRVTVEDNRYIFTENRNESTLRVEVHPGRYSVEKVTITDADGTEIMRQTYRRFRKVDGIWVPHFVQIFRKDTRERLTLNYRSITLNKTLEKQAFTYKVPENAKKYRLK